MRSIVVGVGLGLVDFLNMQELDDLRKNILSVLKLGKVIEWQTCLFKF